MTDQNVKFSQIMNVVMIIKDLLHSRIVKICEIKILFLALHEINEEAVANFFL